MYCMSALVCAMHFLSVIYCIYVFLCGSLSVQNKFILNLELAQQTETMVKTRLCNILPSPFSISIRFADGHLKFVFVKMQPALPVSHFVRRHGGKR